MGSNIDKWKILKAWDFVRNSIENFEDEWFIGNWWRLRTHRKIIARKAKNQYSWNGFGKEMGIQDEWENWDSWVEDDMKEKII